MVCHIGIGIGICICVGIGVGIGIGRYMCFICLKQGR